MDVSDAGQAALKILAGAAKKEGAKVRVVARTSSAPPPKELRSLFHTAGEMRTVRAARVMSALEDAGLAPAQLAIVGEADKPAPRAPRAKRPPRQRRPITSSCRSSRSDDGPGVATHAVPDVRCLIRVLVGLVICGAAAPARAYDFSVDVRTIGQGYRCAASRPTGATSSCRGGGSRSTSI